MSVAIQFEVVQRRRVAERIEVRQHRCIRERAAQVRFDLLEQLVTLADAWGRRIILSRNFGKAKDADLERLDDLAYMLESVSDRIGALDLQFSPTEYVFRGNEPAPLEQLPSMERDSQTCTADTMAGLGSRVRRWEIPAPTAVHDLDESGLASL